MAVPHSMRSYQGSEQFSSRCTVQEPDVSIPFSLPTGTPRTNEDTNRRAGRLGAVKARLDFPQLVQTVGELFQEGLAPATRKAYESGKRRYRQFCNSLGVHPTPAMEQLLQLFVASLMKGGLAHSTIKNYLAAVRHLHLEEGLADPKMADMARLQLVVRGAKKQQTKKGSQGRLRLPIMVEIMELKHAWERAGCPEGQMLWAAASLCFFGFQRSGKMTVPEGAQYDESTHLSFRDLAVNSRENPRSLKVRLKTSKTDPFRRGVDLYVGRTGNKLCPVGAMPAYLGNRGKTGGPLFCLQEGKPLTRPRFVQETQKALRSRGISADGYTGHSFRSGAATTAAARGLGEATIKMLGRWSSAAYQVYIKTPRDHLALVAPLLADGGKAAATTKGQEKVRQQ